MAKSIFPVCCQPPSPSFPPPPPEATFVVVRVTMPPAYYEQPSSLPLPCPPPQCPLNLHTLLECNKKKSFRGMREGGSGEEEDINTKALRAFRICSEATCKPDSCQWAATNPQDSAMSYVEKIHTRPLQTRLLPVGVGWAGRIRMRRMDKKQPKIKNLKKLRPRQLRLAGQRGRDMGKGVCRSCKNYIKNALSEKRA